VIEGREWEAVSRRGFHPEQNWGKEKRNLVASLLDRGKK